MKKVQISCLGKLGRFGNSLYQYAFARAYAEEHGAILETNDWIGRKLFENINEPIIKTFLPRTSKGGIPWGRTGFDLYGYYQSQECLNIMNASKVREWYTFKDKWHKLFPYKNATCGRHGWDTAILGGKVDYRPVVAYLRRGDYVAKYKNYYCIVGKQSYKKAFLKFGIDPTKVYWITGETEDPLCPEAKAIGAEYLPNFFILMNSDHFFRANSTFCLWAGFLGKGRVYGPVVGDLVGERQVDFVQGNHPRIAGKAVEFPPADFVIRDRYV